MSAIKLQLRLAEKARADITHLLSHTQQNWGEGQLLKYEQKIRQALDTLVKNPQSGRKRHGLLVYPVGRHKIFYRVEDKTIYILRILHERMDAPRHLPERG